MALGLLLGPRGLGGLVIDVFTRGPRWSMQVGACRNPPAVRLGGDL